MASPFQQQSLYRKVIYFGIVVGLFTVSLLHRKTVINAQAEELRLREADRGEVAITDTAFRLSLSGLRGVAVTSLWLAAIERQKKHEWSEMEVLVRSLTKLQPHYTSPWLYQSWNLAFNVSVECDRSRDKYFYISRGVELLAEGERKNRGNEHPNPDLRSPAHPEMRYYVGFTYQLKIGQGDEKRTLKSLLDLSMIDPVKRNPEALMKATPDGGKEIDLQKFKTFCEDNPRLVRRLREQLGYQSPTEIVNFLADNREVPSRFEKPEPTATESLLKPAIDQFPVLPPRKKLDWPDPTDPGYGGLEMDVFQLTRAWYDYAQEPLPPESKTVGDDPIAIPGRHRLPKMAQIIFRAYPARAQAYIAEDLEKEGWFDGSGWTIGGWFDELNRDAPEQVVTVGTRFHAGRAWQKAYDAYIEYGVRNAIDPKTYDGVRQREAVAARRAEEAAKRGDQAAVRLAAEELRAAQKDLAWLNGNRSMTNYPEFIAQTNAERSPETVTARKRFYQADRLRLDNDIRALAVYREAIEDWIDVMLRHPTFSKGQDVQEDSYEAALDALKLQMVQKKRYLEPMLTGVANMAWQEMLARGTPVAVGQVFTRLWPTKYVRQNDSEEDGFAGKLTKYLREQGFKMRNIMPMRTARGPLDLAYVYAGSENGQKRIEGVQVAAAQLGLWSPTGQFDRQLLAPQSVFLEQLIPVKDRKQLLGTETKVFADRFRRRLLLAWRWYGDSPGRDWEPLIDESYAKTVRDRRGWTPPALPQQPAAQAPKGPPPRRPR